MGLKYKIGFVLYTILITVLIFGINYAFTVKFISPKIVSNATEQMKNIIDENYHKKIEVLNKQIELLTDKIMYIENERAKIAKDIDRIRKEKERYVAPTGVNEIVQLFKERGYVVSKK